MRDAHFGEGAYAETETKIRTLLGERASAPHASPHGAITASDTVQTPETYLGTFRAQYSQEIHANKTFDYTAEPHPYVNEVELQGQWSVQNQKIVAGTGAHLLLRYVAPRIYVVAAPPAGAAGSLSASVDGKALPRIAVPHDDLYELAHLASPGPTRSTSRCGRARACTRSRSDNPFRANRVTPPREQRATGLAATATSGRTRDVSGSERTLR